MKKSLLAMAALSAMGASAGAGWSRRSSDEPHGHELRALDAGGLQAYVDATDLKTANAFMQAFGNTVLAVGKAALAANPAADDIIRPLRIPAGSEVSAILLANTDLDTNGSPEFDVSIGFEPVKSADGPTANYTYFAAAGQTVLQSANEGKVYAKFTPIKFEFDVYLAIKVVTDAATFAAGTIYAQALGKAVGVK